MTSNTPAMVSLPGTRPKDDAVGMWWLQWQLLPIAESALGARDQIKKIYQPQFSDDPKANPVTVNTPNLDGAFAKLSQKAADNWHLVLFQLAHETVHLLNPIVGLGRKIEEGIAFEFSLYVQQFFADCRGERISIYDRTPSYLRALSLVRQLPGGALDAGKRVRQRVGALESITLSNLEGLFPNVDKATLFELVERFDPNAQPP